MMKKVKSHRFIIPVACFILLFFVLGNLNVNYTQTNCATRTSFEGWAKCSIVFYCFHSSVSNQQKTQIERAITKWNTANQSNNSKVKFRPVTSGFSCELTFKSDNAASNDPAATDPAGGGTPLRITSATITFYPNGTFPNTTTKFFDSSQPGFSNAYEKAALHEIGHTMGLNHLAPPNGCSEPDQVSVMNSMCNP
jgi:hypothetical protein